MQTIKHTPLIYEYKKAVDLAACVDLKAALFQGAKEFDCAASRNNIRSNQAVSITNVPAFADVDAQINLYMGLVHQNYVTRNPVVMTYATQQGVTTQLKSTYSFRFYNPSDCYEWHCDWNPDIWSVLSYVLYLDDDYEGGDLLFSAQRLRIRPAAGSILAFPADLAHVHKSTKIRSGLKSIVYGNFFKELR